MKARGLCSVAAFILLGSADVAAAEQTPAECGKELSLAAVISIVDRELADRFGSAERPLPSEIEIRRVACEYVYTEIGDPHIVGAWFGVTIAKDGKVAHFEHGH